jgi:hypothetical protein
MRALVTAIGLGANRPQDAVYPTSLKDANSSDYDGTNKYVMHFAKGELPPVEGFWSLTMYNSQYFFVANPIDRYSISPRQNLKSNPDGSVDLYIQNESPGGGQGIELASGPDRQVRPDAAHLLARREPSIHPRWFMETTGGAKAIKLSFCAGLHATLASSANKTIFKGALKLPCVA